PTEPPSKSRVSRAAPGPVRRLAILVTPNLHCIPCSDAASAYGGRMKPIGPRCPGQERGVLRGRCSQDPRAIPDYTAIRRDQHVDVSSTVELGWRGLYDGGARHLEVPSGICGSERVDGVSRRAGTIRGLSRHVTHGNEHRDQQDCWLAHATA